MLEEVLVGPVEFALVAGNAHADERANEVRLFQRDRVLQDVVAAAVHVDLDLNDRREATRVGDEERGDVQLILVDGGLQRIGIDKIGYVHIAMQPFTTQDIFDAFQRAFLDGDDEGRFAVGIPLDQPLKRLQERVEACACDRRRLTVPLAALELSRFRREIARLSTISFRCSVA